MAERPQRTSMGGFQLGDFVSLEALRDACMTLLNPIMRSPHVASGETLPGAKDPPIELVAGVPQRIKHKLQRMPVGRWILAQDANAVIWDSAAPDEATWELTASADVTIRVRFF
ncbi:MAG: hypothetical protein HY898_35100 [Deltaproteobacteria bacterium]|nr:hypothetical protein [Deltaproteobacteria bacterium]